MLSLREDLILLDHEVATLISVVCIGASVFQLAPTIANACPSVLSARSPHSPFHAALQGPSKEAVTLLCIAEV